MCDHLVSELLFKSCTMCHVRFHCKLVHAAVCFNNRDTLFVCFLDIPVDPSTWRYSTWTWPRWCNWEKTLMAASPSRPSNVLPRLGAWTCSCAERSGAGSRLMMGKHTQRRLGGRLWRWRVSYYCAQKLDVSVESAAAPAGHQGRTRGQGEYFRPRHCAGSDAQPVLPVGRLSFLFGSYRSAQWSTSRSWTSSTTYRPWTVLLSFKTLISIHPFSGWSP